MFHRYRYEAEFYPMLNRIPLDVRMKLDLTGIKISLKDWLTCGIEERAVLCHLPVNTAEERQVFAAYLGFLSCKYRGQPAELTEVLDSNLWNSSEVPAPVTQKTASCFTNIMLDEWQTWEPHQRYALYKTAISKSQPEAFADILDELRTAKKPGGPKSRTDARNKIAK
jgi:hypothetical protein